MSETKKTITSALGPIKTLAKGIKATNFKFSQKVYEDEDYTFRKLDINVTDEVVAYTVGQYVIKGEASTKWIAYNKDALYYIRRGKAWVLIGDGDSTLEAGYYVCVPKDTRHKILNNFNDSELIVDLIFPGQIVVG